ncbi:MAG TPA: biotin--[acetyl-CoA-carboxylase] ligase [Alphaproteobacteria bacterium]|nr:biotin--[acetyl-CoA-carboxylase] ligase [Alphaproteobacteria bacterium]
MSNQVIWRIQKLPITGSTNDDAKRAAENGETEGLVVWALQQTAGRGRHGRTWQSPAGNLFCSILLRPKESLQKIGCYSFLVANAMYDTVRQCLPVADITLKWPNDVLVEGKKIGGILLETVGDALIVGVGLNVMEYPEEALFPSTSLRAEGAKARTLDEVLDMLLQNIRHWYGVMQKDGFEPIRQDWLKHAQKGPLSVKLPNEVLQGEFAGLGATGDLRLKLADGSERAIATGDVFIG